MALKGFFIALIVCLSALRGQFKVTYSAGSEENQNDSSSIDAVVMMRSAKVVLHPPKNITFFLITASEAVIGWLPPEVYPTYDVNTSSIDLPENATLPPWLNHTRKEDAPSTDNSRPETGTVENVTAPGIENVTDGETTKVPPVTKSTEEICHSLDFFANYSVGVSDSEGAMNNTRYLITLKDIYQPRNVTADVVNKDIVSFSKGCLREYRVFYYENQSEKTVVQVNVSERPEVHLKNLKPGTNYSIFVAAVFVSNKTLNSSRTIFETATAAKQSKCMCDWHGTQSRTQQCSEDLTKPCSCRPGYRGRFCEQCAPGFYRTAPYFPCHRCPCAQYATRDASCGFREGFLRCAKCEVGYTGNVCHMCAYGFYRYQKFCAPCDCNNNHDPSQPHMCDPVTGMCACLHNTSGSNCERCHEGFVGDALHFKNCTLKDSGSSVFKVLPQGVIAAICVGAILCISFLVGCFVYWRMSKNPPKRPFWTVELKDDHEGVNFNTVPNDDFQVVDPRMNMEDMDFYEEHGGLSQSQSGGSAGKRYARLQEQV